MRKTKVYVAGPYTIGNTADNINLMVQVCDALLTEGYVPFCPLLNHFWHLICPRPEKDWLEYDNEWLDVCDCMYRLPGVSAGADREEFRMIEQNKPIFKDFKVLCENMPKEMS